MNTIGIVKATNFSEEYPDKGLPSFDDKTALEFLLRRLKIVSFLNEILVLTTDASRDDHIVDIVKHLKIKLIRGNNIKTLENIYRVAQHYKLYNIVEIYGNAPLLDIYEMERMVRAHTDGNFDYSYNEHKNGVIYGMGCSVISFNVLKHLVKTINRDSLESQLGSKYIPQHPDSFKIQKMEVNFSRSNYRVAIDQPEDIDLIKNIIKQVADITNENIGKFLDEDPLIVNYQQGSGISETSLEKIYLFPSKIEQFLKGNIDNTYPIAVELSLTNKCNCYCIWCSDCNIRERSAGEFTIRNLKKLFKDLKLGGVKGIVIEGGGEPMLHPDFEEIAYMANEMGFALGLISNGSIKLSNDLVPLFEWIRISLDAATPEQHNILKKVNMFETIMKNIWSIGMHTEKKTLGIGYVVTKNNIENLETLLLSLRLCGVDYVQFRPVIDHPELLSTSDISYLKKYETPSFKIDIAGMITNKKKGNGSIPCICHSLSTVIAADGSVYLCGRLNMFEWVKPLGNIHINTFREIWYGEERKKQTTMVSDQEFCKKYCPECRMTKYNGLMNQIKYIKTRNFV